MAVASALADVHSLKDVEQASAGGQLVVLHFWASWCEPCGHMDGVMAQLASELPDVRFMRVEAEAVDEVTIKYSVATVPYFVLIKDGRAVDSVEGADPPALTQKVTALARSTSPTSSSKPLTPSSQPITTASAAAGADASGGKGNVAGRIKYLLTAFPAVLFMKGNASAPACGFSGRVVNALKELQLSFHTVDILADGALRQGLKEFSNWPTYPQLYVAGELVGGCDIVTEMSGSGELKALLVDKLGAEYVTTSAAALAKALPPAPTPHAAPTPAPPAAKAAAATAPQDKAAVDARIKQLLHQKPVMLFMKGNPAEPKCGFSRKVVEALQSDGIPFGTFDILSDEAVRQGLKEYSNWPTYPQLYVRGELLGGCDIVLQMKEAGELKSSVESALGDAKTRLQALLAQQPVMLFMKGSPHEPRCGFSRKVVEALQSDGIPFGTFDILSDEAVRQGLKEYSNWPTYPQLYVRGELLGGCDIVLQMKEAGELKSSVDEMLHRMDVL